MIALLCREKNYNNILSCLHRIPFVTGGHTELLYQYRASVC